MHKQRSGKRRTLRKLAAVAYERELRKELIALHDQLHEWLDDRIDEFALTDAIHKFHDGASRNLFVFYTRGRPEIQVAQAVAHGVLTREEVPAPILEDLASMITFYEEDVGGENDGDAT